MALTDAYALASAAAAQGGVARCHLGSGWGCCGGSIVQSGRRLPPSLLYLFTQKFGECCCQLSTVDPGSPAKRAGIQPWDCIQFACMVGGLHFDNLLHHSDRGSFPLLSRWQVQHHGSDCNGVNHGVGGGRVIYHRDSKRDDGDGGGRGGPNAPLNIRMAKFALECKRRGMRTGNNNLCNLLADCTLPRFCFLSNFMSKGHQSSNDETAATA